ncbi:50S ribosomal protein L23 [Candidatus Woesearchaeota archaeon]|nr:50S ribosomal protein L23 [Candidatus Woesearchaeota archaeon]
METLIRYPLATEKAIRMIESENTMTFEVERKARKEDIKKQVETLYKVKVTKVNTMITPRGTKRAYVKLGMDTPAIDVATQLGLI